MRTPKPFLAAAITALALLTACGDAPGGSGATESTEPYAGIGTDETVHFVGTEPFWGGEVASATMTYSTPENPDGGGFAVERFAGNNGVSWTGMLDGAEATLAVTPGACSDGMSDRTYPFVAMLDLGGETRQGCAWTDARPFTEGEATAGDDADPQPRSEGAVRTADWQPVRIRAVTCGDNCYVEYEYEADGEAGSALCDAPLCASWVETGALPAAAQGRLAEIRLGTGTQYDGGQNVMSTDYPAIVAMRWMR